MVDPFDDRFDLIEPFCSLEDGVWYRARSQAGNPVDVAVFSSPDDDIRRRLTALSRARHPHLAELLDVVDLEENRCAAVFAAANGPSLRDRLERRDGTVKEAIDWGHRVAEALGVLHRNDLMHGDVEPGWIRLVEGRGPVLTGLELNRREGRRTAQGRGLNLTLPYAPAEQLRGDALSPASDLYSLSAVLFHALTGAPPLGDGEVDTLRQRILTEKAPALARLRVDLRGVLGYALDRALSSDSRRRFADAEALRKALRSALVVAPRLGGLPLGASGPGAATASASVPEAISSPPPVPPSSVATTATTERTDRKSDVSELSESDLEPISGSHPLVSGAPRISVPIDALDGPGTPPVGPSTVSPPDEARLDDEDDHSDLDDGPTQVDNDGTNGAIGPNTEPAPPMFSDPSRQGAEPDLQQVGRKTGDYAARPPRERRGTASWRPPAASSSREAASTPRGVVGTPAGEELPREPTLRMVYGADGVKPLAPETAVTEPAVVGEKAFAHLRTLPLATEINRPPNAKDPRQEPTDSAKAEAENAEAGSGVADADATRDTTPSNEPPAMEADTPENEVTEDTVEGGPAIAPPPPAHFGEVSVPTLRIPRTKKRAPLGLFVATLLGGGALFAAGVGVGSLNSRKETTVAAVSPRTATTAENSPASYGPPGISSPAPSMERELPPEPADPEPVSPEPEVVERQVLRLDGLPPGASITVDGVPATGSEIPIEDERQTVEIQADGFEPWRTEIGRGEAGTLVVHMLATPVAVPEPRPGSTMRRRATRRRATPATRAPSTVRRAARRRTPAPSAMRRPSVVRDPGF